IHRLDKGTSGILIVALDSFMASILSTSLQRQSVASLQSENTEQKSKRQMKHMQRAVSTSLLTPWSKKYRLLVDIPECIFQHNRRGGGNNGESGLAPPSSSRTAATAICTKPTHKDLSGSLLESHGRTLRR